MSEGPYKITEEFERALSDYTGSKYCVCVDNASNGLFLALMYENVRGMEIEIPCRTYVSVPMEIIRSGAKVKFRQTEGLTLTGAYQLSPTKVYDSALRFTYNMYLPNTHMIVSFTGPYKHLKLSKGGAILTDSYDAYLWMKRARFSGRRECDYFNDNIDFIGINCYLMPEISARGLLLMKQFYCTTTGAPKENPDLTLPYPDLSKFPIFEKATRIGGLDDQKGE